MGGPIGAGIGAGVGLLGAAFGVFGDDSESKALIKKQKEMAEEAARQKKRNEQARMQALGQSMLAFNPQNQMMAQMFGPQAAFSPQQMAQMAADPTAGPEAEQWIKDAVARGEHKMPPAQWMEERGPGRNASGKDGERAAQQLSAIKAHARAVEEDQARRDKQRQMIEGGLSPLPQGPAPIQQTQAAPTRRY
jgi:hypothetical protein